MKVSGNLFAFCKCGGVNNELTPLTKLANWDQILFKIAFLKPKTKVQVNDNGIPKRLPQNKKQLQIMSTNSCE